MDAWILGIMGFIGFMCFLVDQQNMVVYGRLQIV